MKNLFDDFMEELRRRQEAQSSGDDPNARPTGRRRTDGPSDGPDASDDDAAGDDDADGPRVPDDAAEDDATAERDDLDEAEPEPIRSRTGPGGRGPGGPGRPRARRTGGPDDGAPRLRDRLRGIGLAVVIFAILATITLAGVLLDLITDAIWYRSVGFDAVFFTRLGTQAALFLGVLGVVLVFLGLNFWLAGRLAPPPDPERAGSVGGFAARLGEAFGVELAGPGRRPGGRTSFGGAGFGEGRSARSASNRTRCRISSRSPVGV